MFTSDGKDIEVKTGKPGQASTTLAPPSTPAPTVLAPAPAPPPPPSEQRTVTVYVTESDNKYHRDGCRYLSKSKMAISLEDAKAKGYGPCRCAGRHNRSPRLCQVSCSMKP